MYAIRRGIKILREKYTPRVYDVSLLFDEERFYKVSSLFKEENSSSEFC